MKIPINIIAALFVGFAAVTAHAQTTLIYFQGFGDTVGETLTAWNSNMETANADFVPWGGLGAVSGGNAVDINSITNNAPGVAGNRAGTLQTQANVGAAAGVSLSMTNGYVTMPLRAGSFFSNALIDTAVDLAGGVNYTFSWKSGANGGATPFSNSLALEIGGNWYVSAPVTPIQGNLNNNFDQFSASDSVTLGSETFYSLTAETGSAFAVGTTAVTLPTGDITAFGLYLTDSSSTQLAYGYVFDSFGVSETLVVPEPKSLVLMLSGLVFLAFLAWRKSQASLLGSVC